GTHHRRGHRCLSPGTRPGAAGAVGAPRTEPESPLMFTQKFQAWVRRWAERFVSVFRESPITPNMLTLFGLVITGAGAFLVAVNLLLLGGLVLTVAGFSDFFVVALARVSGTVYRDCAVLCL